MITATEGKIEIEDSFSFKVYKDLVGLWSYSSTPDVIYLTKDELTQLITALTGIKDKMK